MARRFVKFQNYRNIGVSKSGSKFEQFSLNSSLEKDDVGELIIVIGENNVGKSNILDGIAAIKSPESGEDAPLFESDEPDFIDYEEDAKPEIHLAPEIQLVYDGVDGQGFSLRYFLGDDGKAQFKTTNLELVEKTKLKRQLSDKSLKAIKDEFASKFDAYEWIIKDYSDRRNATYSRDLAALKNYIVAYPEGIDVKKLKDVYLQLQTVLDNFVLEYNEWVYYPAKQIEALEFIDLDSIISYAEDKAMPVKVPKDVIKEKCGICLVPQIVYYKEKEIKNSDLETTPDAVKDSQFFASLLKAAGKSIDTITQAYEKARKATHAHKRHYQDIINEALKEKVSKKFNALYFHGTLTQEYSFEIELGKDEIYLAIGKNGNPISISQQSTGFRWFFNFFFNFLYAADLQAGDIVLMDEPDAHLAIPAKRELRRFLKDFAKSTGITFIATTQHPEFIDPDFLDELRIIKHKGVRARLARRYRIDFTR